MATDEEIKECPHCPVKGSGPYMERHIFRCGKNIPIFAPKKQKTPPQETK